MRAALAARVVVWSVTLGSGGAWLCLIAKRWLMGQQISFNQNALTQAETLLIGVPVVLTALVVVRVSQMRRVTR